MTITNDFNIFANNYHKQNGTKRPDMITITDLPDDILEIIKYKTIDMNRKRPEGKYWDLFNDSFDSVLDDIDDSYVEETQEEGESFAREVFNYLYWNERLTKLALSKEDDRIYDH